jgi:hypothetical protein
LLVYFSVISFCNRFFKLTAIRLDKHEQWLKIEIIENLKNLLPKPYIFRALHREGGRIT